MKLTFRQLTEVGLGMEEAFLNAITASPEDDTPRLVFADWLDEHGRRAEAELIRLQCRLDPDRDRYDDSAVNALRDRLREPLRLLDDAENRWWLGAANGTHVRVAWRRGFVDALKLTVQDFLRHGEAIRRRYPLLRKLVLFRLNGWGERLAACEWLRGIREIDLPCWCSDDDARAVAASPHLGAVERVVCWSDDLVQGRTLARGPAWPGLRDLHLVARSGDPTAWVVAVNEAAGRAVGSAFVAENQPFPIAADFDESCFLVGKLPDGTQLFLSCGWPCREAFGVAFDPDGAAREGRSRIEFPPEVVDVPQGKDEEWQAYRRRHLRVRNEHLREAIGFEPAMIRVRTFDFYFSPMRFLEEVEDWWGRRDPPDGVPDRPAEDHGYGLFEHDWVTGGCFVLCGGNSPWCDGSGHITST